MLGCDLVLEVSGSSVLQSSGCWTTAGRCRPSGGETSHSCCARVLEGPRQLPGATAPGETLWESRGWRDCAPHWLSQQPGDLGGDTHTHALAATVEQKELIDERGHE